MKKDSALLLLEPLTVNKNVTVTDSKKILFQFKCNRIYEQEDGSMMIDYDKKNTTDRTKKSMVEIFESLNHGKTGNFICELEDGTLKMFAIGVKTEKVEKTHVFDYEFIFEDIEN